MNDLDRIADRLHELGRRAPAMFDGPLADIRRGRVALRRRRVRRTAGVATLVAAGAVAATLPGLNLFGGGSTALAPTASPSGATSSATNPSPSIQDEDQGLCTTTIPEAAGRLTVGDSKVESTAPDGTTTDGELPFEEDPKVIAALHAYRQAAATILDPASQHIDLTRTYNQGVGGGGGWACDRKTGPRLTSLATSVGWASGDALGVVSIEVARTDEPEKPIPNAGRWIAYDGALPQSVTKAEVALHSAPRGGQSVLVARADGLTIQLTTEGVWDNNMPPGSPAAADLPGVADLVAWAASPLITFPTTS